MLGGPRAVAIRRLLGEDEDTPMTLFFGYMGCIIFFGVGPVLLGAHAAAPLRCPSALRAQRLQQCHQG